MMQRLQALFSGTVQGVGFRYSTVSLARRYKVVGYVQNLPDGRVKVLAEGEKDEVRAFLQEIKESDLKSYIRQTLVEWSDACEGFETFEIKH